MRWLLWSGYALSLVVHVGIGAGIGAIPKETRRRATTVTVFEAKAKKEKPKEPDKEEKPPEPPKPVTVPKQLLKPAEPTPAPAEPPPPTSPTPPGHEAMAALPDFGISLGGGVGAGGLAIPTGGGGLGGARPGPTGGGADKRARAPAALPTAAAEAPCTEPPTKPAYRERVMPQYSDDARAAGIEGRVRVEITVNADGDVIAARVVEGLGHGLDESALVALKRTKFRPITRCGKPVASPAPFVVPLRFSLAD
jgi:protein TonB